jgi:hypothetical protein
MIDNTDLKTLSSRQFRRSTTWLNPVKKSVRSARVRAKLRDNVSATVNGGEAGGQKNGKIVPVPVRRIVPYAMARDGLIDIPGTGPAPGREPASRGK